MIVNLALLLLIVIQVNCENTSIENEKVLLNQSLKTLRKDYNELLENVDKLVKEFGQKFGEAGNVAGLVPQITEQTFKALPSIETHPQSPKPVELLEATLNQAHQRVNNPTNLGFAGNIDATTIKLQNKQITQLTTDLNQILEPLKNTDKHDSKTEGNNEEDSFLSAKGPTRVHPLFTFSKGKTGQTG